MIHRTVVEYIVIYIIYHIIISLKAFCSIAFPYFCYEQLRSFICPSPPSYSHCSELHVAAHRPLEDSVLLQQYLEHSGVQSSSVSLLQTLFPAKYDSILLLNLFYFCSTLFDCTNSSSKEIGLHTKDVHL